MYKTLVSVLVLFLPCSHVDSIPGFQKAFRHLPGKNGVICLLREKGDQVEAFR